MKSLFAFLEHYAPLSDEDKSFLDQHIRFRRFPKNKLILREGTVCQHVYFVERGLARFCYFREGQDTTTWFGAEGTVMTILDSLLNHRPSRYSVQTLEESWVYTLTHEQLLDHSARSPTFARVVQQITLANFLWLENWLHQQRQLPAEQRYAHFLTMHPALTNRVPLTHIASYIGITLETLSRIRRNLRQNRADD